MLKLCLFPLNSQPLQLSPLRTLLLFSFLSPSQVIQLHLTGLGLNLQELHKGVKHALGEGDIAVWFDGSRVGVIGVT